MQMVARRSRLNSSIHSSLTLTPFKFLLSVVMPSLGATTILI
jgi:hypothetical protein